MALFLRHKTYGERMKAEELFRKEKKYTLRERAFQQMRRAILSGGLKPGTRLIEQELSEQMGISRFPIREALASLEREGLVAVEPYKGAFVKPFNEEEINELYSVRSLLEVHALQLAMQRNAKELEKNLRDIVEQMKVSDGNSDSDIVYLDFLFHETISQLSKNTILYQLWEGLASRIQMYLNLEIERSTQFSTITNLILNHTELCDLVASGKTDEALNWLKCHLESGRTTLHNFCLVLKTTQE